MNEITQTIDQFEGTPPSRGDGNAIAFNTNADKTLKHFPTFIDQLNVFGGQANALKYAVNLLLAQVEALRNDTQGLTDTATTDTNAVLTLCQTARDTAIAVSGAVLYSAGTTYAVGTSCIGSDGNTYRRINSSGTGDNPVGSETGNWRQITMLTDYTRFLALDIEITESLIIKPNAVAIGVSGCQLATNARITIGQGSCLRLV